MLTSRSPPHWANSEPAPPGRLPARRDTRRDIPGHRTLPAPTTPPPTPAEGAHGAAPATPPGGAPRRRGVPTPTPGTPPPRKAPSRAAPRRPHTAGPPA